MVAKSCIDGAYTLEFASNLGFKGSGLVALEDGLFRGNNASYEWTGNYTIENGELKAEITVQQFSGGVSIFGTLSRFSLIVSGPVEEHRMTLTGYRREDPSDKVIVLMKRRQAAQP